jgi:hypothetical protein
MQPGGVRACGIALHVLRVDMTRMASVVGPSPRIAKVVAFSLVMPNLSNVSAIGLANNVGELLGRSAQRMEIKPGIAEQQPLTRINLQI